MSIRETLKSVPGLYSTYLVYRHLQLQSLIAMTDLRDRKRPHDSVPIPPARLRHRVHGSVNASSFLQIGQNISRNLHDLCSQVGQELYKADAVLDFGCGSGRVLRNFLDAPPSCGLYGTDIDADLIRWCERNLPRVSWNQNAYLPPLPYVNETFDVVYAISVFTHLAWLAELQRVVKTQGLLILSVHGEPTLKGLPSARQEQIRAQGFYYLKEVTGRLKADGLPDFYQTTYHTQAYIQRVWSQYFDVIRYVERGINDHQDAVLLRRRTA